MKDNGQPNKTNTAKQAEKEKSKDNEIIIEFNYGPYLIYFLYMLMLFIFFWLTIGLGPQGDYIFTEELGVVISLCSWIALVLTLVSYELSPILNPKRRKK